MTKEDYEQKLNVLEEKIVELIENFNENAVTEVFAMSIVALGEEYFVMSAYDPTDFAE